VKHPPRPELLDNDERVAVDLPCVACGYNLRTLRVDSVCPECAAPVERSFRQVHLRWADAGWVGTLAGGAGFLAASCVLLCLCVALAMLAHALGGAGFAGTVAFGIASGVLALVGILFLTAPDPAEFGRFEALRWRRPARWCLGLFAAIVGVSVLLVFWDATGLFVPTCVFGLLMFVSIVAPLFAIGLAVSVFMHVGDLMTRIPSRRLARGARIQAVASAIVPAIDVVLLSGSDAGIIPITIDRVLSTVILGAAALLLLTSILILIPSALALSKAGRQSADFEEVVRTAAGGPPPRAGAAKADGEGE